MDFRMNITDFYDFPLHPVLLTRNGYMRYCNISDRRTQCYIDDCYDQSADRVFSPSNFLCNFKREHFLEARECLEKTEPLTFLKCDHSCHMEALKSVEKQERATLGKVFTRNEMSNYERELDLLCTFQACFRECEQEIIVESCEDDKAELALTLISQYIRWHASDLYDWHILSETMQHFPSSCQRLVLSQPDADPVIRIMNAVQ
ncbi:unnamed protein product [Anisakis simplex]|uniref:Chondroitin proteoglycan 4 domain-containing protein n=1 Tax=Anisakis simplex TaxID=6269 RepID=A0A0M3JRS5_ANISI|nr:unnamed protein product [Anisakis simplex]